MTTKQRMNPEFYVYIFLAIGLVVTTLLAGIPYYIKQYQDWKAKQCIADYGNRIVTLGEAYACYNPNK